MSPSLLTYRMPFPDLINHIRTGLGSIHAQAVKLDALWALDKKMMANVPLAVTNEGRTTDWRQIAADEDKLPTLFDFDEPEQESNKSINTQKRPLKLFFPTLQPQGESRSNDSSVTSDLMPAFVAQAQSVGSSTRRIQSAPSISDAPKTLKLHPAPSTFRVGAMERLANMMNRPLVVPGGKPDRRSS